MEQQIIQENQEQFDEVWDITDIKCSDCGGFFQVIYRANGPDDYTKEYVCRGCGRKECE